MKPLRSPSSLSIEAFLQSFGLESYATAFLNNDIDEAILTQLTDADLRELGIASLGHRKRLLAGIAALAARDNVAATASPSLSVPAGERRQLAVLFADLSGYTALSRSVDPEELHEIVAQYTKMVDKIIIDYGGTVNQHVGDGIMALFGAPRAHDDDVMRAARTGLEIHAGMLRLTQKVGRILQAHVGIASGEVVTTMLLRAEAQDYAAFGDTVNLASRLCGAAAAGQTLLSQEVQRALSPNVVCEAQGEMSFKGIHEPVKVWKLCDISDEVPSVARSAFVGRDVEVEQFASVVRSCLSKRAGQVVYIRGEAGIGKTRLVEEMRHLAEAQGFASHRALVLDFGVGKGQDPIRSILRSLLGLSEISDVEQRRAEGEKLTSAGVLLAEQRMFLDDLLSVPQSEESRALYDAMQNSARNRGKGVVLSAVARYVYSGGPTLIIVEDLHWAETQILEHLAVLAGTVSEGPAILLMTSRVEGDPIDAAWRASTRGTPLVTMDLGPLRPDEALNLARGFIDATQRTAQACIDRAQGNPLFLEQLLRNAQEGNEEAVPASLQSLVLARLDRLEPLHRGAFQAAAVIGQRFEIELLRHLIDVPEYTCDHLIRNALVVPEGDSFLFAHALIQEGAYRSLLRAKRRVLHQRAADWFADRDLVLRAQHLDRAEDDTAPAAYLEAAVSQRLAYHVDTALRLVARGLIIARTQPDIHRLMLLKGELQRDLGDISGSIATHREAVAGAPDELGLCRAQLGLAEGLRVSEGLSEARALLDDAEKLAAGHDLLLELARIHHMRGNILFPLGDIEGCRREHERGLECARRSGSPEAEANALGGLADAAYAQGRMRTAFEHFSRCVALSHEHGFGRIEVANRSMVGFSRIYLNEPREAREDGQAAVRAAYQVGQPRAEMLGETIGVFSCYELAEYEAMQTHLEGEMRLVRQLGARRFEAQNLEMQGRMFFDLGQRSKAEMCLRQALSICEEVGTQFCGPKAISALSRVITDHEEKDHLLDAGMKLLSQGTVGHNHLWFYRDAIEAKLVACDGPGALRYIAALESYTAAEPLPWSQLFLARGRALADAFDASEQDTAKRNLVAVRSSLLAAGLKAFLPAIDSALN